MIASFIFLVLVVDANPIAADPLSKFRVTRKSQHGEDLFVFQEFYHTLNEKS
jgi:hypothetical protein